MKVIILVEKKLKNIYFGNFINIIYINKMNSYQTPQTSRNTVVPGAPKKPEVPYVQKNLIEVQKQLQF